MGWGCISYSQNHYRCVITSLFAYIPCSLFGSYSMQYCGCLSQGNLPACISHGISKLISEKVIQLQKDIVMNSNCKKLHFQSEQQK